MSEEKTATALVVDDNFDNRGLSALALTFNGYDVYEAEDGEQALALLEKQTFDLLILDMMMPVLSGAEVLRRLDGQGVRRDMIIIVMTANPHMIPGELAEQADFVMNKPIDVQAFGKLAHRLSRHAYANK